MGVETLRAPVALSWRIREDDSSTWVEFFGEIDENADFTELKQQLRGRVVFQLAKVRRINSCGVREWVNFVRELRGVDDLRLTHCSPVIVTQLNMIYNFRGQAEVQSFIAPYVCESCNIESENLLDVAKHFPNGDITSIPEFVCDRCGTALVFDDLPERYLAFINQS